MPFPPSEEHRQVLAALATSPQAELYLRALTALAGFALLLVATPVNVPLKPILVRALAGAPGKYVRFAHSLVMVSLLALLAGAALAPTPEPGRIHLLILQLVAHSALHAALLAVRGAGADVLHFERALARREMVDWQPPAGHAIRLIPDALAAIFRPSFSGDALLERAIKASSGRILLVMNHQMTALEIPLLIAHVRDRHNLFPRSIADHIHFYVPGWGEALRAVGAIDGTRENVSEIMRTGQPLLVFPGGGNEVMKSKVDEKYVLKWKARAGFARLAVEHGYTIVPVAAVGLEDQLDVIADIPVGQLAAALGLAKGSRAEQTLPVLAPRLGQLGQRLYFRFMPFINTAQLQTDEVDASARGCANAAQLANSGFGGNGTNSVDDPSVTLVMKVRELTKSRIEQGLKELLVEREQDPHRFRR
jgi:1-acyl-sn-glycerol-3-phosphate acyltransferase